MKNIHDFAHLGWHIFPAPVGTKKSHIKADGGPRWGATNDPETVARNWQQFPDANIGIACGESGLFVIDIDTPEGHGRDGFQWLNSVSLPHTVTAVSPSGSMHFYFRQPSGDPIRNSESRLAPGVDVRGEGGMVIAPPSRKPDGRAYAWADGCDPWSVPVAEAPEWLLDLVRTEKRVAMPRPMNTASLAEVRELLTYIHPDQDGQDGWFFVMAGIHEVAGGSDEGMALLDEWSQQSAKYDPQEIVTRYRSFTAGQDRNAGMGTIAAAAKRGGADVAAIGQRHRFLAMSPPTGGYRPAGMMDAPSATTMPRPDAPIAEPVDENPFGERDFSHDGLALALGQDSFDRDAKYVADWKSWFFWTGTHWAKDNRREVWTRTRSFLRSQAQQVEAEAAARVARAEASEVQRIINKLAQRTEQLKHKQTVAAVEALAQANKPSVAVPDDFDRDLMLVGTPGGNIDLRTGELKAAQREDMLTMLTTCAPAEGGTSPDRWLAFLNEIFAGDEEVVAFMQRLAGYALTGKTTEHKLFFLYGTGRNGKSVFMDTLMKIWGDYARKAAAKTFLNTTGEKHDTGLADLRGRRLVIGSELPKGKTWDEALIKDLTGGDRQAARVMRGDYFEFDPQLTLMIAGNSKPSFRAVDVAIRSRVVLVPFTVTIPDDRQDRNLAEKLQAEGPAILRWAVDGALEWQRMGGLAVPKSIADASAAYMDSEDILGQFLADEAEIASDGFEAMSDVYTRYEGWSTSQGFSHRWSKLKLKEELVARPGLSEHRRNNARGVAGMRLNRSIAPGFPHVVPLQMPRP